jgi:hypothetical protein
MIINNHKVPDNPDNWYNNVFDAMISRCPCACKAYAAKNNQVWSIIRACAHEGLALS